MALDDFDLAGIGPPTEYCGHSVRTVELLAMCFEQVVNLAGGQWSLDIGLCEHRSNSLELTTVQMHTLAMSSIHITYRQTAV